ncbi:indole-3-glycerol phosphate synthase TrpC [Minwuia sp.]|uniref:indole-3-glycerol phosphate synthase TrpC n=1 Tax=Minwuia sp. TaxID=2493630 RepID=UPI003A8F002F
MGTVLDRICDDKREHIARCKAERALAQVEAAARAQSAPRGFVKALRAHQDAGRYGLITEIKKASPSKGLIREDFDPPSLARAYEAGGASCLSVLTDIPYFQGADGYMVAARTAVDIPVLRKDFMLDPYQIVESRALGADCILLIMAALSDAQAVELEDTALVYGMDVLIEVHDLDELERAKSHLKSQLIGVNNRNLKTLDVDLATTEACAAALPDDAVTVSESGLYDRNDLDRMARAGCRSFLIGESLMRQDDVEGAVRALLEPAGLKAAS